jgi:putative transposase
LEGGSGAGGFSPGCEAAEAGVRPYLVFIDETGFMLDPLIRRTWAPRGKTPVIEVADSHDRISAIGALTISPARRWFGFHSLLLPDNTNFRGHTVVRFVDQVQRRLRGPVTILWDSIRIHAGRAVDDYLTRRPRIVVEALPPHAPELNPVDRVWSYVKYGRLANYCPHDLAELRRRVGAEFRRVRQRPRLLVALFRQTELTLD